MEKAHAKLSASGSSKWLNCPGSIKAEEEFLTNDPEKAKSSIYADEGTLAHELADQCLKNEVNADHYLGKTIKCISNGVEISKIIDLEMVNFVQEYLDYVLSFETDDSQLYTETKVDFSNLVENGFGTCDATVIDYKTGICHIFDLKYGIGVEVSAIENTQGQLYALGLYNELKCLEVIKSFVIHIVQPRKYNYSSWKISLKDLVKFGEEVKQKALLALEENPIRIAGAKQCEWCKAKGSCSTLASFVEETISAEFDNLDEIKSNNLSDEKIKSILDNSKLILSFLKEVEDNAFTRIASGKELPGYKIVEGRSNRKWGEDAENILIEKLGKDKAFKSSLITITDAEKLLKKAEVDKLTIKPKGKLTLVPESDKRQAVTNIIDDFSNINENEEDL